MKYLVDPEREGVNYLEWYMVLVKPIVSRQMTAWLSKYESEHRYRLLIDHTSRSMAGNRREFLCFENKNDALVFVLAWSKESMLFEHDIFTGVFEPITN